MGLISIRTGGSLDRFLQATWQALQPMQIVESYNIDALASAEDGLGDMVLAFIEGSTIANPPRLNPVTLRNSLRLMGIFILHHSA